MVSDICERVLRWLLLARLLLHLLLRVELTWHLLLLWERLESIVWLLHIHVGLVGHELVLLRLHIVEWILILAHVLLLIEHHSRLELLCHVGSHHLHHLVLLLHVGLRLLLFVTHWVRDEASRLSRLCTSCVRVLRDGVIHCEWVIWIEGLLWLLKLLLSWS